MVVSSCVQDLLRQTAVLKLNGGLGTSMGLEKAKSLLEVRCSFWSLFPIIVHCFSM